MAGQVWSVNTSGGYMYADNLSRLLRMAVQPMVKFRQFCDVKDAAHQGLHRGDTFHWNVYSDVATQGTTLTETSTIPETSFTISQGTMTITEAGNSVPYTGKLDDLSEQPVAEVIRKVLKNDATKGFDNLAAAQFDAAKVRVTPTAGTSTTSLVVTENGASATVNNIALGKEHVKLIVDEMKERNIPAYADDDYYSISRPSTYRQLKNDLEGIKQYIDAGFQMIMNGEIGRTRVCVSLSRPTKVPQLSVLQLVHGPTASPIGACSLVKILLLKLSLFLKKFVGKFLATLDGTVVLRGITWEVSASFTHKQPSHVS